MNKGINNEKNIWLKWHQSRYFGRAWKFPFKNWFPVSVVSENTYKPKKFVILLNQVGSINSS